jgi:hypothetical protein
MSLNNTSYVYENPLHTSYIQNADAERVNCSIQLTADACCNGRPWRWVFAPQWYGNCMSRNPRSGELPAGTVGAVQVESS